MAQIFTFSEIPEELWSQATELAERLLLHQKESGPRMKALQDWMPWNYTAALARAEAHRTEPPPD